MTLSTRTLGCLFSVATFALFAPAAAWAAPEDPKADADLDLEADLEAAELEADDVSEDDKDVDIDIDADDDDDKGCTIATGRGQNLGGLLCTLGLLGWQLRRRRPA